MIHFLSSLSILLVLIAQPANSQKIRQTGSLIVQNSFADYTRQCHFDSSFICIELKTLSPTLVYDLRYAGKNNFVHRTMYPSKTNSTFLRYPAAKSLSLIQETLKNEGLGLKLFDAYRPYSVTCHFWKLIGDERYVANPAKGSGHNRGLAVDLTLINLATGEELDMGTDFDHFSDTAHHSFKQLSENVLLNRQKLKSIMEAHGFQAFETEWWHYSWPNDHNYPVMDFTFNELKRVVIKKRHP